MTRPAKALREALRRHGVDSWNVHADVQPGDEWATAVDEAVRRADSFIILISPGDEVNRWLLSETRRMLTRVWGGERALIAVLAPAVGAIPSALRNQSFVRYFPHDEIALSRWVADSAAVDRFVAGWLTDVRHPRSSVGDPRGRQVSSWRNAVVHLGRHALSSPADREIVRDQLRIDLDETDWSSAVEGGRKLLEAALERAVLAQHVDDSEMALEFFRIASELARRGDEGDDAGVSYSKGLALLGSGDSDGAAEYFERAVTGFDRSHGPTDPRTVASLYHLGLALSSTRDLERAEQAYRDALDRSRRGIGPRHPQTAAAALSLALLLIRVGRTDEAVQLLEEAEATYAIVTPPDSPELATVRTELARLRQ